MPCNAYFVNSNTFRENDDRGTFYDFIKLQRYKNVIKFDLCQSSNSEKSLLLY